MNQDITQQPNLSKLIASQIDVNTFERVIQEAATQKKHSGRVYIHLQTGTLSSNKGTGTIEAPMKLLQEIFQDLKHRSIEQQTYDVQQFKRIARLLPFASYKIQKFNLFQNATQVEIKRQKKLVVDFNKKAEKSHLADNIQTNEEMREIHANFIGMLSNCMDLLKKLKETKEIHNKVIATQMDELKMGGAISKIQKNIDLLQQSLQKNYILMPEEEKKIYEGIRQTATQDLSYFGDVISELSNEIVKQNEGTNQDIVRKVRELKQVLKSSLDDGHRPFDLANRQNEFFNLVSNAYANLPELSAIIDHNREIALVCISALALPSEFATQANKMADNIEKLKQKNELETDNDPLQTLIEKVIFQVRKNIKNKLEAAKQSNNEELINNINKSEKEFDQLQMKVLPLISLELTSTDSLDKNILTQFFAFLEQ